MELYELLLNPLLVPWFPGEVTAIYGLDFQVNVMHKSGNIFWKWPLKEYKILYEMQCYKKIGTTRSRRNEWPIYF